MALIEKLPNSTIQIGQNGHPLIEIGNIARSDSFDQIINGQTIIVRNVHGHQQTINISSLQIEIDSSKAFDQRKSEIEKRAAEFRNVAQKRLAALREKGATLRSAKFNEVIRLNAKDLDGLFDAFGENSDLARFLILEGHLDDTYYQYTSLFHAGRLSPNDNKFLIQIRSFINPDADFPIDNPKEVVAAMRSEDFRQQYVLNVKIVDCLLGNALAYADEVAKLFEYLTTEFDNCGAFFISYYGTGTEVPKLVAGLRAAWPGFIPAVIADLAHLTHVGQIIAHLPTRDLTALPDKYPNISSFVSEHLAIILALGIAIDPSRLKSLRIELTDLSSIESFPGIARFLFDEGCYTLTIENLAFIFRVLFEVHDLKPFLSRNYTTIIERANPVLSSRIERGFGDYLKNVLLRLEDNSDESIGAILALIARDDADFDDVVAFLERQRAIIPSLDDVPVRFHPIVFKLAMIEASWVNVLAFISSETLDRGILTAFLGT